MCSPCSIQSPSPSRYVEARPPRWGSPSKSATSSPASTSDLAQDRPDRPPPATTTRFAMNRALFWGRRAWARAPRPRPASGMPEDLVVVEGPGFDPRRGGAEGRAAVAAGTVFAVGQIEVDDL